MTIKKIFVHCSATKPSMDIGVKTIRDWHVNGNGWSDIGYHEVIRRNGECEAGRPANRDGAHARGHNKDSYAICMVGGINEHGKPDANFTAAQYHKLAARINALLTEHGLTKDDVLGHRDVDPGKACPSFDIHAFIETL